MSSNTVNCSNCRTSLQLPPGAACVRCALCHAVTLTANTWAAQPYALPSPYAPPPNTYGRKKAVIVGISYRHSPYEIKGSIDLAKWMRSILIDKFHFPPYSIFMLTEEDPYGSNFPIKQNIMMAMNWLVEGCRSGDSLVFYFAGHGSQQRNRNGDEVDGYDEFLYPLDFDTQGVILDDNINAMIVRPIPHGVRLHALIDASHSGTILDLPFLCKMKSDGNYEWKDHRPRSGVWKGSSGGEVICFSGCDDDEAYNNTTALGNMTSIGAMTICFIQAIVKLDLRATYGNILNEMRTTIRNSGRVSGISSGQVSLALTVAGILVSGGSDCGIIGSVLTSLASVSPYLVSELGRIFRGQRQKPQLTAWEPFYAYGKQFWL